MTNSRSIIGVRVARQRKGENGLGPAAGATADERAGRFASQQLSASRSSTRKRASEIGAIQLVERMGSYEGPWCFLVPNTPVSFSWCSPPTASVEHGKSKPRRRESQWMRLEARRKG